MLISPLKFDHVAHSIWQLWLLASQPCCDFNLSTETSVLRRLNAKEKDLATKMLCIDNGKCLVSKLRTVDLVASQKCNVKPKWTN